MGPDTSVVRLSHPSPDSSWLALADEAVIDPDLAIVDAHHHLWDNGHSRYLLDELAGDIGGGHRIVGTVVVQGGHAYDPDRPAHLAPVGETEAIVAIAEAARTRGLATEVAAGIVAYADLTLGARLDALLDAHEEAAAGRFKGIRHSVSRDPHFPDGIAMPPAREHLLADPAFRAGLSRLAARGLRYDAMLYHAQLPELIAAARAMPRLTIVLNHLGCILGIGPYRERRAETFVQWRSDMANLASCANVTVKIGGLGMILGGSTWHERPVPPASTELASAWRPYVETCIELFGADRCMFESNFPMDKAMYSYRTMWNAFKRLAAGASDDERAALFAGTAARTYGLPHAILTERHHA